MSDPQSIVSQLLIQILSLHSPEPGARLKQKLKSAFQSSGHGDFNEKLFGFQKFTDYLTSHHSNILKIVKSEGGDVLVYSRTSAEPTQNSTSASPLSAGHQVKSIRSDLWQAFTNPDSNRRRFYHKKTGRVLHYSVNHISPEREAVELSPESYVEINPVSSEIQIQWMKKFLAELELTSEQPITDDIIPSPFNSTSNSTFIKSLGKHSVEWRSFRLSNLIEEIERWATESRIEKSRLYEKLNDQPLLSITEDQVSPKQQIIKLLDLLTEDDVSRFVLPVLLSTILIKSRI